MKVLREGYTTGTCAAAAAKAAAIFYFTRKNTDSVDVILPRGETLRIPVSQITELSDGSVLVTVIKDAGDDPDITNGKEIQVKLTVTTYANPDSDGSQDSASTNFDLDSATATDRAGLKDSEGKTDPGLSQNSASRAILSDEPLILRAGEGVGTVTKPGLPVAVGEPAINPNPRKMISENLSQYLSADHQLTVEVIVPEGKALAQKTLNPHLGIIGGISILGTTGIVKPMSEEAFKVSLVPQLKTAFALGYRTIVLTPGNIGMESAVASGIPEDAIVITSNFIGYMLENAVDIGFANIILWGHLGKLVKIAGGIFDTHNRVADARMEIIATALALEGAPKELITTITEQITTEAAETIVAKHQYGQIWEKIADKASLRAERFLFSRARVGVVLLKDRQNIICINKKAKEIGAAAQWNFLQ